MICILKIESPRVVGWFIADDIHDARQWADSIDEMNLAAALNRMESTPPLGAYVLLGEQSYFRECEHGEIGIVEHGWVMLVS